MRTAIALFASIALLAGPALAPPAGAADFRFSWKANTDPGLRAYGVYQRTGDSPYVLLQEVSVADLEDPAQPSYLVTGLAPGATYRFAATAVFGAGEESDFFGKTCITVNGKVVECLDDDESGAVIAASCFISAAGARPPRPAAP
jgi:hypothetical protein